MEDFIQFIRMVEAKGVIDQAYPRIKNINDERVLASIIGTIIDLWVADHGLELDDGLKIVERLLVAMKEVHETKGMVEKTT